LLHAIRSRPDHVAYARTRGRLSRVLIASVPLAALLAGAAVPAGAQEASRSGVSLTLGLAGGGGLEGFAVVPGIELRTRGAIHLFGAADAYLVTGRASSSEPPPAASVEVTRTSLSPPRLRAGLGWRVADVDVRGYVGQQGIVEGFQPLVGAGAVLDIGGWGIGVDGSLHRGTVYERVGLPEHPGVVTETPLRTTWTPRWQVSARTDLGTVPGNIMRPVLIGSAAGAAGGLLGGLAGAVLAGCSGEGCAGPVIVGAVVGGTLTLPLGVHLAEGRRGSLAASTLASVGIAAAGVAATALTRADVAHQGIWVLVPVGQMVAAIAIERRARAR
jgi:hypothetical protein